MTRKQAVDRLALALATAILSTLGGVATPVAVYAEPKPRTRKAPKAPTPAFITRRAENRERNGHLASVLRAWNLPTTGEVFQRCKQHMLEVMLDYPKHDLHDAARLAVLRHVRSDRQEGQAEPASLA